MTLSVPKYFLHYFIVHFDIIYIRNKCFINLFTPLEFFSKHKYLSVSLLILICLRMVKTIIIKHIILNKSSLFFDKETVYFPIILIINIQLL